jgi:hypothetical protein
LQPFERFVIVHVLTECPHGPRRPGRKEILTLSLAKQICDEIEKGIPVRLACEAHGVSPSRFITKTTEKPAFGVAYARARRALCLIWLEKLETKNASSAMFFLERRFREEFGKPKDVEVNVAQCQASVGADELQELQRLAQRHRVPPAGTLKIG